MQTQTAERLDVRTVNRLLNQPRSVHPRPFTSRTEMCPTVTKDEVLEELKSRLPFAPARTQRRVLRGYDKAASGLSDRRRQMENLIQTIIRQSLDLSRFHRPEVAQQQIATIMLDLLGDCYHIRFTNLPSAKSLALLAEPAEVIYEQLAVQHERNICLFVDELFDVFGRMQMRHVLGTIRYSGEHWENCEFTHFRSKAISHTPEDEEILDTEILSLKEGYPYLRDGKWWKKQAVVARHLKEGYATIQHVRTKQLLSAVQTIPLDRWALPLPERVVPVAEAIPDFLRPWASVVHGTREYELSVAADVGEAPYTYTDVNDRESEVRHYDPCLLLGPMVIAGWCPEEQPAGHLPQRSLAKLRHHFAARKGGVQ